MECRECDSFIHDFMRGEVTSEEVRAKVFDHIMHCARCEVRFSNIRSLESALRNLAASMDSEGAAARMEPALRTVFQQQKRVKQRSRLVTSGVAIGIAASLLLSIGVVSWRWSIAPKVAVPILATPNPVRSAEAPIAQVSESAPKSSRKVVGNRKWKARIPAQHAKSEEFVTGFYALPYAGSSDRVFNGEIVRVKLRGSALPAMGFPVALSGDQAGEQITADLLVAENGLPVAIRFIR